MDEPLERLASVLRLLKARTGERFGAASFSSRLRTQKAVYLLQDVLGHRIGPFAFSRYLHGPYSPSLAQAYYDLGDVGGSSDVKPIDLPEEDVALVAEAVGRGNAFLEAVATVHSYARSNPDLGRGDLTYYATESKPHLSSEIEEAVRFLDARELLPLRT